MSQLLHWHRSCTASGRSFAKAKEETVVLISQSILAGRHLHIPHSQIRRLRSVGSVKRSTQVADVAPKVEPENKPSGSDFQQSYAGPRPRGTDSLSLSRASLLFSLFWSLRLMRLGRGPCFGLSASLSAFPLRSSVHIRQEIRRQNRRWRSDNSAICTPCWTVQQYQGGENHWVY